MDKSISYSSSIEFTLVLIAFFFTKRGISLKSATILDFYYRTRNLSPPCVFQTYSSMVLTFLVSKTTIIYEPRFFIAFTVLREFYIKYSEAILL